jgi:hypothetical protein
MTTDSAADMFLFCTAVLMESPLMEFSSILLLMADTMIPM